MEAMPAKRSPSTKNTSASPQATTVNLTDKPMPQAGGKSIDVSERHAGGGKTAKAAPKGWRNRIVEYGEADPEQLLANPSNWRVHPKEQQSALTGVLSDVGWVTGVIVNKATGYVVDGHMRVAAAISQHETSIPVTYVNLTEDEERLVLATIDPISAMAVTDADMLADLLKSIETDNADVLAAIQAIAEKNEIELSAAADALPDPGDQSDRADELQQKWKVKRGDIWQIGKHRLMCGDSTVKQEFPGLSDNYVAFVDPFFQDDLIDRLYLAWNLNNAIFLTGGHQLADILRHNPHFHEGVLLHCATIPQMGNYATLMYEHKVILWCHTENLDFGSGYSSVVESKEGSQRLYGDVYHHTSKPIDVCEKLLKPFSQAVILDLFGGSGSVLVATERLGRQSFTIEIEPKYCAAILQRATLTGLEAHRV